MYRTLLARCEYRRSPWYTQIHPMKRTVSSLETHSFIPWNSQFHPMKLTVSSIETHSFILWNAQFHPMKLTVSSLETHSFILGNSQFHPRKLTVSSRETHSFIPWPIPWNNIRAKYQKVRRVFQDSQIAPLQKYFLWTDQIRLQTTYPRIYSFIVFYKSARQIKIVCFSFCTFVGKQ